MKAKRFNYVDPKILEAIAHHSHNRDLPAELVKIFSEDVRQLLVRFDQALNAKDLAQLQFLAHRIKGSCLNVGAQTMAGSCAAIERSLAAKIDWNNLTDQINRLDSQLELTTNEFGQLHDED